MLALYGWKAFNVYSKDAWMRMSLLEDLVSIQDKNGVTLAVGGRVFTKNGKEAYIVSLHHATDKVRIQFPDGFTRKFKAKDLRRGWHARIGGLR